MRDRVRQWWTLRTVREQRMLLAMLGTIALFLGWLVIWWGDTALSDARRRHAEAVIAHARVAGQVQALKDIRRAGAQPLQAPIDVVVGQSASETGFVLSRTEPQGRDRVTIAIATARPQAFFGWIDSLERQGIFPEKLTARANSDRTISIEATLRGRGI